MHSAQSMADKSGMEDLVDLDRIDLERATTPSVEEDSEVLAIPKFDVSMHATNQTARPKRLAKL